jgi:DNA invertase Pin-like site-specific DNA recombinase
MAWSVDRLGRSLQDLVGFLSELHAVGIDLFLHQQGLDTTTPAGKAMFQMMGVFAEFERAMIQERVRADTAADEAAGGRRGQSDRLDVRLEGRLPPNATRRLTRNAAISSHRIRSSLRKYGKTHRYESRRLVP